MLGIVWFTIFAAQPGFLHHRRSFRYDRQKRKKKAGQRANSETGAEAGTFHRNQHGLSRRWVHTEVTKVTKEM